MLVSFTPKVKSNIFYAGALWQDSTALHRMKALQNLRYNITAFDTHPEFVQTKMRCKSRSWKKSGA